MLPSLETHPRGSNGPRSRFIEAWGLIVSYCALTHLELRDEVDDDVFLLTGGEGPAVGGAGEQEEFPLELIADQRIVLIRVDLDLLIVSRPEVLGLVVRGDVLRRHGLAKSDGGGGDLGRDLRSGQRLRTEGFHECCKGGHGDQKVARYLHGLDTFAGGGSRASMDR